MDYARFVSAEPFELFKPIYFKSIQLGQLHVHCYGVRYDASNLRLPTPAHQHDFFEFHYITGGEIATSINGVERLYRPGEYYLMPPFTTHSHAHRNLPECSHTSFVLRWKFDTAPCDYPSVELNSLRDCLENAIPFPIRDRDDEVARIVWHMVELARAGASRTELMVLFVSVITALGRQYAQAGKRAASDAVAPDDVQRVLNRAIAYIDAHCGRPITVEEVAGNAHVSYSHLSRQFARYMNCSIVDYMTRVRVDRAQRLLLTTSDSVGQVGQALGFSSISHFSNTFKRMTGLSPLRFRAAYARLDGVDDPTRM
ncbi:MAG: AraC family transcriptional regulator [Clostridiales bacterium]|nr:AraC family transcriptional regulator [Clostridiales bacterium]